MELPSVMINRILIAPGLRMINLISLGKVEERLLREVAKEVIFRMVDNSIHPAPIAKPGMLNPTKAHRGGVLND